MKVAVVTGASSGMGRALAVRLTKQEHFDELWVIARREEALASIREEVDCRVRVLPLDLSKQENLMQYQALLEQQQPEVSVLANCAGFGKFGDYSQIKLETSLNMIDLNVKALVAVTEMTLPYMKAGGRIVQLDSMSAFQPIPYLNVYAATKSFVLSYSRSLNRELRPRGIRVMAVCPYWVKTAFFDRANETNDHVVKRFDRLYTVDEVIDSLIKALYHSNTDVCIPGLYAKLLQKATKLLPHRLVMDVWMKQHNLK